jgi:hypothetical protein
MFQWWRLRRSGDVETHPGPMLQVAADANEAFLMGDDHCFDLLLGSPFSPAQVSLLWLPCVGGGSCGTFCIIQWGWGGG